MNTPTIIIRCSRRNYNNNLLLGALIHKVYIIYKVHRYNIISVVYNIIKLLHKYVEIRYTLYMVLVPGVVLKERGGLGGSRPIDT